MGKIGVSVIRKKTIFEDVCCSFACRSWRMFVPSTKGRQLSELHRKIRF